MNPRKLRSNKPLAYSNPSSNDHRSDAGSSVPTCPSGEGKNPRKRSHDGEEACSAPPKKRINSRGPPTTTKHSPGIEAKRAAPRRSARKIRYPPKKEVPAPSDPEPDVIVIDDDGHPYVTYDHAPHLHPPPRRYRQREPYQQSEQVKGCSIKPCWTPTQQRRCRTLQTDPAVEEIGWKKVRKWMQAVRCRLCGEAQVLRDLTKGCFNLEHWWRHLRVRHGIKREEIQEKGEEKYKMLPIKDHVCVGACSTCGEGEERGFARRLDTRHAAQSAVAEPSDLNRVSSVDITPDAQREAIPRSTTSTPHVEPPAPGDTPMAGPSDASYSLSHSRLYTLANARPQYQPEYVAIGASLPISRPRDLPPLVPQSWAAYVDPSLYVDPPRLRRHLTNHLGNLTARVQHTRSLSSTSPSSSPRLPFVQSAPLVARDDPDTMDAADALLFLNSGPPAATGVSMPVTANAASAARAQPRFRSPSGSAQAQTPPQTIALATQPSSAQSASSGSPPPPHFALITAEAFEAAPGLSDYRWPPVNAIPANAPSPPRMTAVLWEESNTEDEEDQIEALTMSDLVPTRGTRATEDCAVANVPLYRSPFPTWKSRPEDHEVADSPIEPTLAPRLQAEAGSTIDSGSMSIQPEWAFIAQEVSEPDLDEDNDMIDQLLDDH